MINLIHATTLDILQILIHFRIDKKTCYTNIILSIYIVFEACKMHNNTSYKADMNMIIRYLFILTMLSFSIASSPNDLCFFRVYITNGIEDNIAVHVSIRGEKDIGNHTLAFGQEFDWKFGVVLFRTYYSGEFLWGPKHVTISVFNKFVFNKCFDMNIFAVQRCYWMVKPEGFYINVRNDTFPDGWSLAHSW